MPVMYSKDKRGLARFVIGLIIGIICVIPLLYLGSALMSLFFSNQQEILQAKGTLEEIYNSITPLAIGESVPTPLLVYSPAGWWLLGFDKESKTYVGLLGKEEKKKKEGENKICLCICQNAANCEKKSACLEMDKQFTMNNENLAVQINIINLDITNREKFYEVETVK